MFEKKAQIFLSYHISCRIYTRQSILFYGISKRQPTRKNIEDKNAKKILKSHKNHVCTYIHIQKQQQQQRKGLLY